MKRRALVWALCAGACVTRVELARSAPDALWVVGDVPASAITRFAAEPPGPADDAHLSWLYPADGSQLPANLGAMRFAWQSAGKLDPPKPAGPMAKKAMAPTPAALAYYELCVTSGRRSLCVYTDGLEVVVDAAHWRAFMAAREGTDLSARLRGLSVDQGQVISASPRHLEIASALSEGSLIYAQAAQLARAPLAGTSAQALGVISSMADARFALSRDGKLMAFAPSPDTLQLARLPGLETVWSVSAPLSGPGSASLAFDPLARRIAYARAGSLALLDADDGSLLPGGAADAVRVSHPDWSPDGRFLAVTLWPSDAMPDEQELTGSSIARLPVALDGSLGAPELLASASKPDDTLAYPVHARDGDALAYVQLKGKLRDAKEVRLWLVNASGGAPTALTDATMGPMKPAPNTGFTLAASTPIWLPSEDASLAWLVFAAEGPLAAPHAQLWLLPVSTPPDATGPATPVWLPFQDDTTDNAWPDLAPD